MAEIPIAEPAYIPPANTNGYAWSNSLAQLISAYMDAVYQSKSEYRITSGKLQTVAEQGPAGLPVTGRDDRSRRPVTPASSTATLPEPVRKLPNPASRLDMRFLPSHSAKEWRSAFPSGHRPERSSSSRPMREHPPLPALSAHSQEG